MDRRDFLKTTSKVIAGATLAPGGVRSSPTLPTDAKAEGRMILPINRNWRYNKSFVEGAHAREFDDSAFERVVVPHTNVRLPWHSFDDKTYEFVSIYRRRFKLPPEAASHHVFVDFEGVMTASTVWINGVRLGEYKGGYTPFSFDLTPHIHFAVTVPGHTPLITQMYVAGEPQNGRDGFLNAISDPRQRNRVIVSLQPGDGIESRALAGSFDIVLAG